MRIFLIGFMGSGKTAIGQKLAGKMSCEFYDLDKVIEANENQSIINIFKTQGEQKFRELENSELKNIIKKNNIVVATGGGTACYHDNLKIMNTDSETIYLKCSINTLSKRLIKEKNTRPLIENLNEKELFVFIKSTLHEREVFYSKAKHIIKINMQKPEQIVEIILKHYAAHTVK